MVPKRSDRYSGPPAPDERLEVCLRRELRSGVHAETSACPAGLGLAEGETVRILESAVHGVRRPEDDATDPVPRRAGEQVVGGVDVHLVREPGVGVRGLGAHCREMDDVRDAVEELVDRRSVSKVGGVVLDAGQRRQGGRALVLDDVDGTDVATRSGQQLDDLRPDEAGSSRSRAPAHSTESSLTGSPLTGRQPSANTGRIPTRDRDAPVKCLTFYSLSEQRTTVSRHASAVAAASRHDDDGAPRQHGRCPRPTRSRGGTSAVRPSWRSWALSIDDRRREEVTLVHRREVVATVPSRDGHEARQRLADVMERQSDGVAPVDQPVTASRLAIVMHAREVAGQAGELRSTRHDIAAQDVVRRADLPRARRLRGQWAHVPPSDRV